MLKFKVGDRVRHFGSVGTVIEVDAKNARYRVKYENLTAVVYESELTGIELEDDRGKNRTFGDDS